MHMRLRTALVALVVSLLASLSVGAGAAVAAPPDGCAGNWICFYNGVNDSVPTTMYSSGTPRNTCKWVTPPNTTSYIVNFTNYRWYVFTLDGRSCNAGAGDPEVPGVIYPLSQGPMSGWFQDSIDSTYRTSSTSKSAVAGPTLVREVLTGKLVYL